MYNQVASPDDRDVLITDDNYSAIWDPRDYDTINKKFTLLRHHHANIVEIERIPEKERTERDIELLRYNHSKIKGIWEDDIEKKMDRIDNGQSTQDTPDDPAPLEVNKKRDLLTNDGMGLLCSIIIGNSVARPSHYASGNGTNPANVGDSRLHSERARIALATDGFATAAGTTLRFGAIFIPSFPSHVISESGVTNAAQAGRFLNRTVYPSPRLVHTIHADFYTLSITVAMTAV